MQSLKYVLSGPLEKSVVGPCCRDKTEAQRKGGCHILEVTQQGNGQAMHLFTHPKYIDWPSFIYIRMKHYKNMGYSVQYFPKWVPRSPDTRSFPEITCP